MAGHYITANRIFAAAWVGVLLASSPVLAEAERRGTAWGLGLGHPHLIPIIMETRQEHTARLQLTVSPLLLMNSATARLIVCPGQHRFQLFAFVGGGILNVNEGEGGTWTGTTGFMFLGGGVRLRFARLAFFFEAGKIGGLPEGDELGSPPEETSAAVGLLLVPSLK